MTGKKDDSESSIDFLAVPIPSVREMMQNELEIKLMDISSNFRSLTARLKRFLNTSADYKE